MSVKSPALIDAFFTTESSGKNGPKSNDKCPLERREDSGSRRPYEDTWQGHVYQPRNPKNGQQPPEAGGGAWGRLSLNSLGRDQPCQPLDFGFPVSRPWENKSLLFVVFCYGHPRTLIQALAHLPDGDTEAQLVGGDGWEWAGLGSPLGAA